MNYKNFTLVMLLITLQVSAKGGSIWSGSNPWEGYSGESASIAVTAVNANDADLLAEPADDTRGQDASSSGGVVSWLKGQKAKLVKRVRSSALYKKAKGAIVTGTKQATTTLGEYPKSFAALGGVIAYFLAKPFVKTFAEEFDNLKSEDQITISLAVVTAVIASVVGLRYAGKLPSPTVAASLVAGAAGVGALDYAYQHCTQSCDQE